jgi:hypothetical protein
VSSSRTCCRSASILLFILCGQIRLYYGSVCLKKTCGRDQR